MVQDGGAARDAEFIQSVLRKFSDNAGPTIAAAFDGKPTSKYGWTDFVRLVNHLRAEGFLEAKGDGFVVHWHLTKKGQDAMNGSTPLSSSQTHVTR